MSEENALPIDDGVVIETAGTEDQPKSTEPEKAAELAPATESEQESKPKEQLSEGAQKAINKKHWEAQEAKREAAALKARLDALEAEKSAVPDVEPSIPPRPDAYASQDEIDAQMQAREAALVQHAEWRARQALNAEQAQLRQEEEMRKQQENVQKIRSEYAGRATDLGLNADDVMKATADIANYGISDAVAEMIATEADGPLMATYLRQNPTELQALQGMPLYAQINHMTTAVRANAATLRPQVSSAPPPPTDISSGGAINQPDPLLDGATFNTY